MARVGWQGQSRQFLKSEMQTHGEFFAERWSLKTFACGEINPRAQHHVGQQNLSYLWQSQFRWRR